MSRSRCMRLLLACVLSSHTAAYSTEATAAFNPPSSLSLAPVAGQNKVYSTVMNMDTYSWSPQPGCILSLRGYNGGVGGVLRLDAGDTLHLTFMNLMEPDTLEDEEIPMNSRPRLYNISNFHTHGLNISPKAPSDDPLLVINGGELYEYTFHIHSEHAPGTHWYHGHHHGSTYLHVMSGVVGALIINDDPAQTPAWVMAMPEVIMVVRALQFSVWNKQFNVYPGVPYVDNLFYEWETSGCDAGNPTGVYLVVNDQWYPTITVQQGVWTRFRIVMGGPMLHLALEIPSGCEVYILSLDGIYVEAPIHMPSGGRPIFMASGNRRDLAMKCTTVGSGLWKSTGDYSGDPGNCDATFFGDGGDTYDGLVAYINVVANTAVTAGPGTGWFSPSYLRPPYLTSLLDENIMTFRGVVAFFSKPRNSINGQLFEAPPPEGTGAPDWVWKLNSPGSLLIMAPSNSGGHPYHQHVAPFQVQATTTWNYTNLYGFDLTGMWMDTIMSQDNCEIPIKQRPNFDGHQITHCHLLMHEDLGMMAYGNIETGSCFSNCCEPGYCDDYTIRHCVGEFDPPCKFELWNEQCVEEAQTRCYLACQCV